MTRVFLFFASLMFVAALFVSDSAFAAPDDADAIKSVLSTQQAAWNKGDIDTFMRGYWKSPNVRFISGDKITTGWNETLARYHQRYPTRDRMGQLTFSDLDVTMLGPESALVVGRWKLLRAGDTPHGVFSLTFRKIDGNWVIAVDHTS
jgi:ketosteroid isomerase-like protein